MKIYYKLLVLAALAMGLSCCKVEDQIVIDLPMGKSVLKMELRVPQQPEEAIDPDDGAWDSVDQNTYSRFFTELYLNSTDPTDPDPEPEKLSEAGGSYDLIFGDKQLFSGLSYYKDDKVELSVKNATLAFQDPLGVLKQGFRNLVFRASIGDEQIASYTNDSIEDVVNEDPDLNDFVGIVMAQIEARREVTLTCEGLLVGTEETTPGTFLAYLVLGMEGDAKITVNR